MRWKPMTVTKHLIFCLFGSSSLRLSWSFRTQRWLQELVSFLLQSLLLYHRQWAVPPGSGKRVAARGPANLLFFFFSSQEQQSHSPRVAGKMQSRNCNAIEGLFMDLLIQFQQEHWHIPGDFYSATLLERQILLTKMSKGENDRFRYCLLLDTCILMDFNNAFYTSYSVNFVFSTLFWPRSDCDQNNIELA